MGHTVNFKTQKKSYKSKKKVNNDPSEWVIFENTHEAIIDQETFEIVQNIRNGRRRLTLMGEMPVLSGMLFCADCGAKLYQVRARGWTHEQEHFVCATYRKQKGKCTSHQIRNVLSSKLPSTSFQLFCQNKNTPGTKKFDVFSITLFAAWGFCGIISFCNMKTGRNPTDQSFVPAHNHQRLSPHGHLL